MCSKPPPPRLARTSVSLPNKALVEPVVVTKYGRDHLVILSADEYERLKRRDRRVYRAHEVPDDILAAIEAAEPPPESEAVA